MPHADPEKRREYERQYRARNREKVLENQRRWREANPEKQREYSRRWRAKPESREILRRQSLRRVYVYGQDQREYQAAYREANRDRIAERQRAWRQANLEAIREKDRERSRLRSYDPVKAREYGRRYWENNREKERERNRRYREANPDRSKRYYWNNRERSLENGKRYYAANRDQVLARTGAAQMIRNHGPHAPEIFAQMLVEQEGRCYLCRRQMSAPGRLAQLAPCIDHDHRCCPAGSSCANCRRGLACARCNMLIGLAGDDPDLLRQIAASLETALALTDARLTEKPEQLSLDEVAAFDQSGAYDAVDALPAPPRLAVAHAGS